MQTRPLVITKIWNESQIAKRSDQRHDGNVVTAFTGEKQGDNVAVRSQTSSTEVTNPRQLLLLRRVTISNLGKIRHRRWLLASYPWLVN
jgi:hypothetical protein